MDKPNPVNIHSVPCPFGNSNVELIIRDSIDPKEPYFSRGDVINTRLESGPILYAMCPLALAVLHETYMLDRNGFNKRMGEDNCPNPPSDNKTGCMYASAKWKELENFLR